MEMVLNILVLFVFGMLGASLGSFAGAQVWRLRARQLVDDKKSGEKIDQTELKRLKPLLTKKVTADRSRCLSCQRQIAMYDLIPIISWVVLGGKCRYCKKPIGWSDFLIELCLGVLFVLSLVFWVGDLSQPLEIAKLIIWLITLVVLAINVVYDARWSLLVSGLNWLLIALGVVYSTIVVLQSADPINTSLGVLTSVLILGGLYALLWKISAGRWVGEGDIYLGVGLALFLVDPKKAFLALFLANLAGLVVMLPGLLTGRLKRNSRVPFGPFLVLGFILTWFIGNPIIDWYCSLLAF